MSVLTAEDRKFWEENGYVVVHNAVPSENLKAAERAVWDFLEMQPNDPGSWYPDPPRASYHDRDVSASGTMGQPAASSHSSSLCGDLGN